MLASAPLPTEPDPRDANARFLDSFSILPALETPSSCPVCGQGRIASDEVMHGGTLQVSECLDCEHRWTQRPDGRWFELGARMSRAIEARSGLV
jgi:hypothetical protein